jgi:hypothetical protein
MTRSPRYEMGAKDESGQVRLRVSRPQHCLASTLVVPTTFFAEGRFGEEAATQDDPGLLRQVTNAGERGSG